MRNYYIIFFSFIISMFLMLMTGGLSYYTLLVPIALAVLVGMLLSKPPKIDEETRRIIEEKESGHQKRIKKSDVRSEELSEAQRHDITVKSGLKGAGKWYLRWLRTGGRINE